ncbi:MAG: PAS domain-containing sensor histidine kinase [Pseudomonadota bacterium]
MRRKVQGFHVVIRGLKGGKAGGSPAEPRQKARLFILLGALLTLEAVALGLKAWDEKQTRDFSRLESLQRESVALAERLDGHVNEAQSVVRLAQKAGAGRSLITDTLESVDVVLTLRDAASSPDGSRLKAASVAAVSGLAQEQMVSVSEVGDVVFVIDQTGFPTALALARAEDWLPAPRAGQRFTLVSDLRVGRGNPDLAMQAQTATTDAPDFQSGGTDGPRTATACTELAGAAMHACVTREAQSFSQGDLVRFLAFALLLAAPLLAILGLLSQIGRTRSQALSAEDSARTTSTELDLVMSGARAGVWTWDVSRKQGELSELAAELMGLPGAGVYGLDQIFTGVVVRDQAQLFTRLTEAAERGWMQITAPILSAGNRSFVEIRASTSPIEGEAGLLRGIVLDVTEQKLTDVRLRKAEKRLRNAIEGYNDPFALWDERRRLLYWNRAFALTFSITDTLRPGISQDTVDVARAPAIRAVKQMADESTGELIELHSGRWLKLVERETAEGGYITIGVDVTETVRNENLLERQKTKLKSLVQELERQEGQAAELARNYAEAKAKAEHAANTKSAFLANMSHELRTPLNAINGFSEILTEELYGPLGDEKYKGYAKDILTSGQHLLDLINDILDMAKIEAGKMTVSLAPLDPTDPVDAAIRMIRRKAEDKNIALVMDAPIDVPEIEADHRAIRQMVLNLISNALKFTDAGGRITVALRARGDDLQISVIDTGIGIPRDQISRLGRPFEQVTETRDRNFEGTGLGLALTKSFAEMHGGRLAIASEVGKGTRVSIYLPLPKGDAGAIPDIPGDGNQPSDASELSDSRISAAE